MFNQKRIVAIYDYVDEYNKLIYQSIRFEPKDFRQRRYDEYGRIIWGISAGYYKLSLDNCYYRCQTKEEGSMYIDAIRHHVPYHLPQLINSEYVFIVEGEKDVHTLEYIGFTATTNSGGVNNFQKNLLHYFQDKIVIIIADNDNPGKIGAVKRAFALQPYARSIRIILQIPYVGEHGDITNWIELQEQKKYTEIPIENYKKYKKDIQDILEQQTFWNPELTKSIYYPYQSSISSTYTTTSHFTSIYDFLAYFKTHRQLNDTQWMVNCPYHIDDKPSLGIKLLSDNKILINCLAGCDKHDILRTLNLSWPLKLSN